MVAALRLATLAILGFCLTAVRADIVAGTKRADVIAELGKPSSTASRGSREILQYPKGLRLELEGGVVVDIRGYVPQGVSPADIAAAAEPPPPKPKAETKSPAPATSKSSTGTAVKNAPPPPPAPALPNEEEFSPAAAANALGDEVDKMTTAWGGGVTAPLPTPSQSQNWLEIVLKFVLRFLISVGLLRLAFKYWEMDAFWSGTFAIAAIDASVHAIMEALDPITEGFTTLGHVDGALAWFVMIFTVQRFCFNKRLQNAVFTAIFVKLLVTTCDIFVFMALVNAVLG